MTYRIIVEPTAEREKRPRGIDRVIVGWVQPHRPHTTCGGLHPPTPFKVFVGSTIQENKAFWAFSPGGPIFP
jgi:hypothetical protein